MRWILNEIICKQFLSVCDIYHSISEKIPVSYCYGIIRNKKSMKRENFHRSDSSIEGAGTWNRWSGSSTKFPAASAGWQRARRSLPKAMRRSSSTSSAAARSASQKASAPAGRSRSGSRAAAASSASRCSAMSARRTSSMPSRRRAARSTKSTSLCSTTTCAASRSSRTTC